MRPGLALEPVCQRWLAGIGLVLLTAGVVVMAMHGDLLQPTQVPPFLLGGGVAACGFLFLVLWGRTGWWVFAAVAMGLRAILFFAEPGDDIWRYIWEGRIQLEGFSPYAHPPLDPILSDLRGGDWPKINHPEVTAIYPPVTQIVLRCLAAMVPSVWLFKLAVILPDLAICFLLARRFGPTAARVYAWNPMVLYSFAGGGHFDSWFLLPLVTAWLLMDQGKGAGREYSAAALIGLSAAIKWVTFPLLGWLVWRHLRSGRYLRSAVVLGVGLLPFALGLLVFVVSVDALGPLIPAGFAFSTRGSDLVPWLVESIWPSMGGHNGLYFGLAALAGSVLIVRVRRFRTMVETWVAVLLFLGPSNHAWYFTWGLPFAVASRNWGPILLSLSGFTYFQLQLTFALTGRWVLSGFERGLMWLPCLAGWVRWAMVERRTRDEA